MSNTESLLGFAETNFSWREYSETRPKYPNSFFDLLYDYYESHKQETIPSETAMDVGAGHGVIAESLGRRFANVAVCEPNGEYLEFTKRRLSNLKQTTARYSFHQARAEERVLASGSVDVVTMGMCIHWTDVPVSISTAAYHLKPGGTLSVIYYRPPYLDGNREAATTWDEIWEFTIEKFIETGQMDDPVNLRAWKLESGGMDGVHLPSDLFRDVKRIKLNTEWSSVKDAPFALSRKHVATASPATGKEETVVEEDDSKNWTIQKVDARWLMRAMKFYLAGQLPFDEEIEAELVKKLEKALESSNGVVDAVHPVSIILATRR